MATNQNSGIDVFFGTEFNFRVQLPDFRRAHHYKFQKTFFQAVSTENLLFTRAWLRSSSRERKADNSVLVYLCV